ncbi:hypothetical protein IGI04_019860, partial [Brassica rapa subsp. trilocularis]
MPPRNARQVQPTTTAQRAARRAARAASQATSDNGSHAGDGVDENQVNGIAQEQDQVNGPAQGQDQGNGPAQGQGQAAMDAAAVEELRRYREAYGDRLPQEGVAGGGVAPPLAVPACRDRTEAGTGAALPAPPPKKPATLPRVFVAGNNQGTETIAGMVKVGGVVAYTLFDTGATHSFVSHDLTKRWIFQGKYECRTTRVETAGPDEISAMG